MKDLASIETFEFLIFRYDHNRRRYPNWMIRYFEDLNREEQWLYSLQYHKVAQQLVSEEYLIEQLKWILKRTDVELEYDLLIQFMFDEEHGIDEVFKPGIFDRWCGKYKDRFEEEFSETLDTPEVSGGSPHDITDELPF